MISAVKENDAPALGIHIARLKKEHTKSAYGSHQHIDVTWMKGMDTKIMGIFNGSNKIISSEGKVLPGRRMHGEFIW